MLTANLLHLFNGGREEVGSVPYPVALGESRRSRSVAAGRGCTVTLRRRISWENGVFPGLFR